MRVMLVTFSRWLGTHDESTILDGHNRYEICTRLGIEFETIDAEDCHDREAALAWIDATQLSRRNLTPDHYHILRGRPSAIDSGRIQPQPYSQMCSLAKNNCEITGTRLCSWAASP
jgi:hypothetical protein